MSQRYFGRTADLLGLVAYWTVMYGRLPDRGTLAALYDEAGQAQERPQLYVVPPTEEAPQMQSPTKPDRSIDFAA
jgi:hypothetical protein